MQVASAIVIFHALDLPVLDLVGIVRWNMIESRHERSGFGVSWNEITFA